MNPPKNTNQLHSSTSTSLYQRIVYRYIAVSPFVYAMRWFDGTTETNYSFPRQSTLYHSIKNRVPHVYLLFAVKKLPE